MKLRVIVVGRDKNDPLVLAANEYLARLERVLPVEIVEVKEEPARASTPVARVRAVEAERLEKAIGADEGFVALDERGKELTSVELSGRLARWSNEGLRSMTFVIGGPNGLDPSFVKKARETWALSRMTLPHRLARLLLSEQLYRAVTIMRGEPYHK